MIDVEDVKKEIKELPSSVKGLNTMFGSALYNSDELTGMYGKAGVGKSLILVQDAYFLASNGFNVLVVDTEGGTSKMLEKWREVMQGKYGKGKGHVYVVSKRTFESVFEYFGYRADVVFTKAKEGTDAKGSMEFRVIETLDEAEVEKDIEKGKIDFMIVDSVSAPIRSKIPLQQQNNPAKASSMALLLGKITALQERYKIGAVVTAHASFNAAQPSMSTSATSFGGLVLGHFCKRVLYIDRRDSREQANYRRLWLARGEDAADLSFMTVVKYTDVGIEEVEDAKAEQFLTKGEADKISPSLERKV